MAHLIASDDAVRWLRTLPAQCADAIITDPPFCSGGFQEASQRSTASSFSNQEGLSWFSGDQSGTLGIMHLMREVAVEAHRVIRPAGTLTVFTDWRMASFFAAGVESAGWRWRQMIVWDKGHAGPGTGFRNQFEVACHFDRCDSKYQYHVGNLFRVKRVKNHERIHPTEKPAELLAQIIRVVCPPGGMVIDPFAGSGSLLEAAHRCGVSAWVCDRDPVYAAAIERRAKALQEPLL